MMTASIIMSDPKFQENITDNSQWLNSFNAVMFTPEVKDVATWRRIGAMKSIPGDMYAPLPAQRGTIGEAKEENIEIIKDFTDEDIPVLEEVD